MYTFIRLSLVPLLLLACTVHAAPGDIITLSGGKSYYSPYPPTVNALANSVYLGTPYTVDLDKNGNVYITDSISHSIKKISRNSGILSLVAGAGAAGYSGDGGLATQAQLKSPYAVAFDANGNLYFSDEGNHIIRKIDASGVITTVVGSAGLAGFTGDGGDALSARLNNPAGLAFDSVGNLYISDYFNHAVRRVDKLTNIITTVAGNGSFGFSGDAALAVNAQLNKPVDIAFDSNDNLFISDSFNGRIRKVTASTGIISSWKAGLSSPYGIDIDASDNIFYVEKTGHQVSKVNTSGVVSVVAGTGTAGYFGDGASAAAALMNGPTDIAIDAYGNALIAEVGNRSIRFVGDVLDFPFVGDLEFPSLDETTFVEYLNSVKATDSAGASVSNVVHDFALPPNYNALQTYNVHYYASDTQGGIGATQVKLNLNRIQLEQMAVEVLPPANVNVLFRAFDSKTKKPFANLLPSDLLVYEDQFAVSVESTVVISKVTEAKHRVDTVLMVDVSSSILPADLVVMKQSLLQGVLNTAGNQLLVKDQRIAVYIFDDVITQVLDFSTDPAAIKNAINAIQLRGVNRTNLYGAIVEGMSRVDTYATVSDLVEGQVLLVTDGRDTAGIIGFYDAKNAIKKNRLHIVGVNVTATVASLLASLTPSYLLNYIDAANFTAVGKVLQDVAQYTDDLAYSFYRLNYTSSYVGGVHTLGLRALRQADYDYTRLLKVNFDTKDFIPPTNPSANPSANPAPSNGCMASGGGQLWFIFSLLGLLVYRLRIRKQY